MQPHPHFIGIDVSKTHLDLAVRPDGTTVQFANTPEGITACVAAITPWAPTVIVIEATGGLERAVVAALVVAGLPVAVINPRQAHNFAKATGQLAKTDARDAQVLAWFGETMRPQPTRLKPEATQHLDALVQRHHQLIEMRTLEVQRLHVAPLVRQPSLNAHIAWLAEQITGLDQQMQTLIEATTEWQEQARIFQSVPGVGPSLTRTLVARLPELGALDCNRLAALVGVAPFNRDSETLRGKRAI